MTIFYVFMTVLIGQIIFVRTIRMLIQEKFLTQESLIQFQLLVLFLQFAVGIHAKGSMILMWSVSFLPLFIGLVIKKTVIQQRMNRFKESFCHIVDLILLEMRSGQSFRNAIIETARRMDPFSSAKILMISERIQLPPNKVSKIKDTFLEEVEFQFRKVHDQAHNAIQRLEVYRGKLRTESDFRRKSGQAVLQIRAQSIVLLLLYFATLTYMIFTFGFFEIKFEIILSATLFSIGLLVIFTYGRRYKWKV